MTWTLVQNPTPGTGSGTTVAKAFASNVTAGNTLVAAATTDPNTTCTFSSTGDTWTTPVAFFETAAGQKLFISFATNVTGGAKTVTATFGTTGNFNAIIIAEYSGGPTSNLGDGSTAGQHLASTTTPTDSPGITTTIDGDLILSAIVLDSSGATPTAGTGFTLLGFDTSTNFGFEAGQQNSHGTIAPSFTLSVGAASGIISNSVQPAGGAAALSLGQESTNRHPGKGPGNARFFQTPRSQAAGSIVNVDGSLVITATTTATIAATHTVGGSLTITTGRSSVIAVTHTVGGSRPTTVNRAATVAVTHTVGGSLAISTARAATVAVTHVVAGSRPISVGLSASIITGKDINGSRPETVNRTAAIAVAHTVTGSRPISVVLSADISVISHGSQALFLPFF